MKDTHLKRAHSPSDLMQLSIRFLSKTCFFLIFLFATIISSAGKSFAQSKDSYCFTYANDPNNGWIYSHGRYLYCMRNYNSIKSQTDAFVDKFKDDLKEAQRVGRERREREEKKREGIHQEYSDNAEDFLQ